MGSVCSADTRDQAAKSKRKRSVHRRLSRGARATPLAVSGETEQIRSVSRAGSEREDVGANHGAAIHAFDSLWHSQPTLPGVAPADGDGAANGSRHGSVSSQVPLARSSSTYASGPGSLREGELARRSSGTVMVNPFSGADPARAASVTSSAASSQRRSASATSSHGGRRSRVTASGVVFATAGSFFGHRPE